MAFVRFVLKWWILYVLIAVLGIAALLYGWNATEYPTDPAAETWRSRGLYAGIGALMLTTLQQVFAGIAERQSQKDVKQARAETLVAMNGALLPIAHRLVEIAALPQTDRGEQVEGLREAVVASLIGLVGTDEARASYFKVTGDPGKREMKNPITRMGSKRTDEPTSVFIEGQPDDEEVWDLIDSADCMFEPNLDEKQPTTWSKSRQAVYKTFISVGVGADGMGFGLLTVNALQVGQLTVADEATMRALGLLLSSAEALGRGTTSLNALRSKRDAAK